MKTFLIVIMLIISLIKGYHALASQDKDLNMQSGQLSYYYVRPCEDQSNFLLALNEVRLGDDYAKIIEILGNPTYDKKLVSKEGYFKYRELIYYFRKLDKDLSNEKYDEYIVLLLDKHNKLVKLMRKFRSGVPYYYESFSNYQIPFQPAGEISYEVAKERESYYIVYYNEYGKIASFAKYLNGNLEFIDKYNYGEKGLLESREMTKSTGEIIVQHFDESGKIIQK